MDPGATDSLGQLLVIRHTSHIGVSGVEEPCTRLPPYVVLAAVLEDAAPVGGEPLDSQGVQLWPLPRWDCLEQFFCHDQVVYTHASAVSRWGSCCSCHSVVLPAGMQAQHCCIHVEAADLP